MEGRRRRFYFHREPLSCPNGLGVLLRARQTLPSPSIFPKNFAVSLLARGVGGGGGENGALM